MRGMIPKWLAIAVVLAATLLASGGQQAKEFYNQGRALDKAGKNAEAIAVYDRAIALDPAYTAAFFRRGNCKAALGDMPGAFADFSRVVELDPKDAEAWSNMSVVKLRTRENDQAFFYACRAIDVNPNLSMPYISRGVVKDRQGDLAGAAAEYTKALSLNPSEKQALINRGLVREKTSDLDGAVEDFSKVIALDNKFTNAYYNRGRVLAKKGAFAAAEADLAEALRQAPGNKTIASEWDAVKTKSQTPGGTKSESKPANEPPVTKSAGKAETRPAPASPAASRTAGGALPADNLALPTIPFRADQPCDAAGLNIAGAPWQKAKPARKTRLLEGIEPADIPVLSSITDLSGARYSGAVAAAKEGLRVLFGPLSESEAAKFEAMWAPIFDYPSQAIIDYLNTLNPLLGRYLAGREALARAGILFNRLFYQMSVCVGYGQEAAFRDSLEMAGRQAEFIRSLEAALAKLGGEISALGNPPNPLQAKCEARRFHEKALASTNETPAPAPAASGIWEGTYTAKTDPASKESHREEYAQMEKDLSLVSSSLAEPMAELMYGPQPVAIIVVSGPGSAWTDVFGLDCLRGHFNMLWNLGPGIRPSTLTYQGGSLNFEVHEAGNPAVLRPYSGPEAVPIYWRNANNETVKRFNKDITTRKVYDGNYGAEYALIDKQIKNILLFNQNRRAFLVAAAEYLKNPSQDPNGVRRFAEFRKLFDKASHSDVPEPAAVRTEGGAQAGGSGAVPGAQAKAGAAGDPAAMKAAAEAIREEIAYRRSIIELLKKNLEKEYEELARENDPKRKEAYAFRVLQLQSDIQSERDLIASHQTGQIVHTRSAFESYAHEKIREDARREAAESDATWRIAQRIDREINLLPEDQRAAKKTQVHRLLDAKTVAGGNLEKARKVEAALHNEVEGYWSGEAAKSEEAAARAEESEYNHKLAVMAAGMVFVGMSGPAFAETFGASAAVTAWAPTIAGASYGGVTGYVEGGPEEALKQSLAWSSSLGYMTTEFYDGAKNAYTAPNGDLKKAFTAGATQAGTAFITGKAFEYGANLLGRGAQALFGKGVSPAALRQFDDARFNQDLKDAKSLVGLYQEKEFELLKLRSNNPPGSAAVRQAETEVRRMAASINSSYHAKLYLKNEGAPGARRAFNGRVDSFYEEMMPGFLANLEKRGYRMKRSDFTAMRNASSEGSVSMDLDLGLNETKGTVILKNGKPVTMEQFMGEAQQSLNESYHAVTRTSATRSNLNLTTSVHSESFSDTRLLKHGVDFNKIDPKDIAQVGQVIQNKTFNIEADPVLSPVAKVQASCRESGKEIGNMLIPLLESKIKSAKTRAEGAELTQALAHWTKVREKFVGLSQAASDGHKIWEIEQEIGRLTGGKSARQTIEDLSKTFVEISKRK